MGKRKRKLIKIIFNIARVEIKIFKIFFLKIKFLKINTHSTTIKSRPKEGGWCVTGTEINKCKIVEPK
jgi:hypothetical protein